MEAAPPEPEPEPGVGSCTIDNILSQERESCTFYSTGEPVLTVRVVNYVPVWLGFTFIHPRLMIAGSVVTLSHADTEELIASCDNYTNSPTINPAATGVGCAGGAVADGSTEDQPLLRCWVSSGYTNSHDIIDPPRVPHSATCRG